MNTLNRYYDFEVGPCVLLDEDNNPRKLSEMTPDSPWVFEACDADNPDLVCWSVFGVLNAAGREAIADYLDRDMAENLALVLRQGLDLAMQRFNGHGNYPT